MSLSGKEKIWFLINRLLDEREITEVGKPIALHPMNDLNGYYQKMDFIKLTEKLEKEHNAIKLLNQVPTDQTYGKYEIKLLPDFDRYVLELRKDPKYLDYIGEKPEQQPAPKTEPISVNHARKNGVMTGKEKIQAVIEDINDKYQGLVTGNTVVLHSGNLGQRGLEMHEQKQVLDILANDKKVIKYTAKNEYKDRSEIHPRDQVDVYDGSMDQLEADEMFEQILAQLLYTVEVLPGFTKLADDLLGDAELEYRKDVFLLRLLYNRVISILDAVVAAGVVIEDDELDTTYVQITALLEDMLNKPSMQDWKKDAPKLYETLLGHSEEIGEGWQYERAKVLKYYAKLQKDWMLQNKPHFELDEHLSIMLEDVYKTIGAHRKIANSVADDLHKKDTERLKKNVQGIIGQKAPDIGKKEQDTKVSNDETADKVKFDKKASSLIFGNKTCFIPDETIEHHICKLVFKNRRVAAKEMDILDAAGIGQDSKRPVYDAMLRVNKKASEQLGIEKLLKYKAAKVRINTKYQ